MDDDPIAAAPNPAAPVAPAPDAPAAPAPDAPTGSDAALAAARARLESGAPLVDESVAPVADPVPADEPKPDAPADPDPATDPDPPVDDQETTEDHPEALTVELPGMQERGEEPLALEVPDQETFERLNRLKNQALDGARVRQAREEITRAREEQGEFEDALALDPTGFVLERMPESLRPEIAMHLLFEPSVLKAVQDQLANMDTPTTLTDLLDDPNQLKLLQQTLRADRVEMRDRVKGQVSERREQNRNAKLVTDQVLQLLPETLNESQRQLLYRDAIRDISDHCDKNKLKTLDPKAVASIIAERFSAHGIDVFAVRPASPAAPAPGQPAARPQGKTGADFVKAREAKRSAAAAPAGAGAPAARPRPNLPALQRDGQDADRAIKALRVKGLRAGLGRS